MAIAAGLSPIVLTVRVGLCVQPFTEYIERGPESTLSENTLSSESAFRPLPTRGELKSLLYVFIHSIILLR